MSSPATFETFQQELFHLVDRFSAGATGFLSRQYDEASLRQDFLNPLLRALGWDLENSARLILKHREVEIESRTLIAGKKKRADYLFRTDGVDRFVCEAKKPFESLGAHQAFQAKRYGWNKEVPLALLSDFEELCIYIVAARPDPRDSVQVGLWKKWHYTEYPAHSREIWDLLSRDAIAGGAIDRLLDTLPKKPSGKGRARQLWLIRPDRSRALDADFLNFLDEARRTLGSDLLRHNPSAGLREDHTRLNEAVQCILDRLLFLRICEDRDIDTGTNLHLEVENWRSANGLPSSSRARQSFLPAVNEEPPPPSGAPTLSTRQLWPGMVKHFRALDRRPASHVPYFNGHLFKTHFIEDLAVGDDWLATFLEDISSDESPYLFAIIPVEILGTIYERFLGKVIRPHGLGVTIEEKPEFRKADGVYYTPRYIVDYIVEQTVGKLLHDQPPEKTLGLRFLDPACGSGSFLIRVFERVCEHWQTWLTSQLPAKGEPTPKADWEKLAQMPVGTKPARSTIKDTRTAWVAKHRHLCWLDESSSDLHLTMHLKRRILIANIYGVDLDPGAIEVTQLSLYLKMLENENRSTLARERELFADAAEPALLPPLAANIKRGNSLIASDFLQPDELVPADAFNWEIQFKSIVDAGGFDAVVGNPPYLNIDDTWGQGDLRLRAIKRQYPHIYNDKTDLLFYFIARSLSLSRNQTGLIVSRAFLEAFKADKLRGFLAVQNAVAEIVDFQNFHVFNGVGITTCILRLEKTPATTLLNVFKLRGAKLNGTPLGASLKNPAEFDLHVFDRAVLSSASWTFASARITAINSKIDAAGIPVGEILHIGQGMQTGCNAVFGKRTLAEIRAWRAPRGLYKFRASNSDIQRFEIKNRSELLLYVEDVDSFESLPAGVRHHLNACETELKARAAYKRGNCDWWRYTWPLHREFYARVRLLCPFLAPGNRFALVEDDSFIGLTDTTVLFTNQQPESMKYLMGLLNSRLLTFRFKMIGKLKGGGIYEYFWNSISKLPIRRIDFANELDESRHEQLVALVDQMIALTPKLRASTNDHERAILQNAVTATDRDIDQLVYQLYGLTPEEIALVEGSGNPAPPIEAD